MKHSPLESPVLSLACTGSIFVSTCADTTVKLVLHAFLWLQSRVWDARTYQTALKLEGHQDSVTTVWVDKAQALIVTGSHDSTIRLASVIILVYNIFLTRVWSLLDGVMQSVLTGHNKSIRKVQIEGRRIYSCSKDTLIKVGNLLFF